MKTPLEKIPKPASKWVPKPRVKKDPATRSPRKYRAPPRPKTPEELIEKEAYNWSRFEIILQRMRDGEDMGRICKNDKNLPDQSLVRSWITQDKKYMDAYLAAKLLQADAEFEKSAWIYDALIAQKMDPQTCKVALDIIKWRTSRLAPRKYHDSYLVPGENANHQYILRIPELQALRKLE